LKWTNKGHEYDQLGERFKSLTAIYLFGAGVHGKTVYEKYNGKIHIKGFIDNNVSKHGGSFCGLPVLSPENLSLDNDEAIVVSTQPSYVEGIRMQLYSLGFSYAYPMQQFFPVLDAYKYGEVCLSSVSFLPTTVCNLRCRYCLNFSPYVKEHQVRPLEQLVQDLDLLFSRIDTLLLLHISGGEPFTYPYLAELVDHITARYGDKLGRLEMTTNGTVVPTEKLLTSMRNSGLYLTVDDYRDALPQHHDKQGAILELLEDSGVSYQILKADSWINLALFDHPKTLLSDEQLREHFNNCSVPWQEYRDGRLWLCNYSAYADIAGIVTSQDGEFFDINTLSTEDRLALVEFRLGYSEKGYTECCKRCSGFNNNLNAVPIAEQL